MLKKKSDLRNLCFNFFLIFKDPIATDAGQYRCNLKNADGETNANLNLNFERNFLRDLHGLWPENQSSVSNTLL